MQANYKHSAAIPTLVNLSIHEGARHDGYADGWLTKKVNAREEVSDVDRLVERARDLYRNGNLAPTIVHILTNKITQPAIHLNVYGEGKQLPRVKNLIYEAFVESEDLDFDQEASFETLLEEVVEETIIGGGCLVLRIFDKDALLGFRLKILEQSFIARQMNESLKSGHKIRNGIEYSPDGKKLAYWIYSHGQDDDLLGKREAVRYDAKNIAHFFIPPRRGASIGLPWYSHLIPQIRLLEDFDYNVHIRNRNAAAISAFIETTERDRSADDHSPGSFEFEDDEPKGEEKDVDDRGFARTTRKRKFERRVREDYYTSQFAELRPGINYILRYGEKVVFPKIPDPPEYNSYYKSRIQSMARATGGASYEDLSGDFSNSSYSAARMSESQTRLWVQRRRKVLKSKLLSKIWRWTKEGLSIRGFDTNKIWHRWEMPDPPAINPKEDAAVSESMVHLNLASLGELIRRSGRDPDAVFEEIAEEQRKLRELGILPNEESSTPKKRKMDTP